MNPNKQYCNCEGFYNESENSCEPLQPNDPNPCPSTFWSNAWGWISQNVTIGGGGMGNNYNPNNNPYAPKKDNTWMYVALGLLVVGVIYFATRNPKNNLN